ncbi:hypothetical protein [Acidovorax soli]|nr:hypothetical protein [Acidovorax soli]
MAQMLRMTDVFMARIGRTTATDGKKKGWLLAEPALFSACQGV